MARESRRIGFRERAYGMKKHDATRLHFDLRLEWNDVLLSWAIPKGPDCRIGAMREAVEMEDHRKAYLQFEGVHETGAIMLWDRGTWEAHPDHQDVAQSLSQGILMFRLHGEKLAGAWTLFRTSSSRNTPRRKWVLSKHDDAFARSSESRCIVDELPNSVSTGRTMEEIVRDWKTARMKHQLQMKLFDGSGHV